QNYFLVTLTPGGVLETHRGILKFDDLIGREMGSEVLTHLSHPFYLLSPSTDDLIRDLRRNSQILYPKDLGFILLKMAIGSGQTVLEAGTGSGSLTLTLAQAVGPTGRVISYDQREDMQKLARKNLERVGLADRVTLKLRDIAEGFDEAEADAFFLDVPNPWDYVGQVRRALRGGGFFGCLVPTTNQISNLLVALSREAFAFPEVCEIIQRHYKPVADRLRPEDRLTAHTGFLIFARPIIR
ncbi:MAG: tRNA (adenine-N1)-methyltransferase, partial [Chloroflexi bacterium]|nr:tRNA (adenine-N1)-methyltransferase [Chloroflexota bacterium]